MNTWHFVGIVAYIPIRLYGYIRLMGGGDGGGGGCQDPEEVVGLGVKSPGYGDILKNHLNYPSCCGVRSWD